MKGILWGAVRKSGAALLAVAVLSSVLLPCKVAQAEEKEDGRVLKVAFPEVKGYSETDENGNRHGVVADYLNEIAKYTGWKYEYIETTGEKMLDEFLEGKYDLMGGTYYIPGYEKYFGYPNYNTGYSKSVLLARRDDYSIRAYDWKSMEGKSVGVYENAGENIRRLQEFIKINNIGCTLKYYGQDQLTDGNLYAYLADGEVDMLLGNNADDMKQFRVAGEFDSQPHYLVTTPDNKEVLNGLNMAMGKIADADPNFAEECYESNFQDAGVASIFLNDEEKEYIGQKKTVSVAVISEWHPLYCMESKDAPHNGLIPDVLKKVEEFTGLTFTYQMADSYEEALEMVQQGKADMLGGFLGTEQEGTNRGLALSKPYTTLNDIVARNKSVSYPSEGLVGGVLKGREMPAGIKTKEVKSYENVEEGLSAVNRGEIDFFYGVSSRIEQLIQDRRFVNVVPNSLINDRNEICFAVVSPARDNLLPIINKVINNLTSEEKAILTSQNLISPGVSSPSVIDMIYANPIASVAVIAGIALLVVILLMVAMRFRVRAAKMQSSLEEAEAANRAKGEFLSRMSHEIRTPMNAIVGLSDLVCMMENVPDKIRENLMKIRSSSRYLLGLISDILDMSRIDSKVMTVASEPFSIGRIINEVGSMMASDAKRRGITFKVHETVRHDGLKGDEVRLKQVLTNLISNALKFTPAGGDVTLSVEETSCTEERAAYHFRVTDSGIGISKKDQERIFGAFEQVGSNYAKSQGTGLGLPISRTIVELMGGELQLKSEPGKGSAFCFTAEFPFGEPEQDPVIAVKNNELGQLHILLAEDNDLNAEIAEDLLAMKGAAVKRAKDGEEAVQIFAGSVEGEFQAILMDIQMPKMDGLESCCAIRRMSRADAATIPIIAMTANSFQEDVDAAKAAGMNDFVSKPIQVDYLYQILQKAVIDEPADRR